MKTLALLSIMLVLPLAAQSGSSDLKPCPLAKELDAGACLSPWQTPLTPDEHDAYVLMVIQDLLSQNVLLENLRTHKAGNEDLENRERAHAERTKALQELLKKHNACTGGDWNIAKKEWACPVTK